ncbi:response regulator transcription factor [Paenibacillus sp. Soil750]|uniref:response regulator transcription factor n=1 Tax=Paenibacillus sp. Soil750 TaxID=1736398 RepID=UPI0006FCDB6C|nr:helix-turn-helix domain-containing protein [Paenibacillus sp. Soil750]KRE69768.1 hypothetical protein ASL11_15500 [Paenibacillus sp. Soil750]
MHKLLIVDDEPYILEGLVELFTENEQLELTIFKASSAFEAIAILERIRMDIVLTDIRMPQMSGLQLLDQIKMRWPRCKVIFLTGHNEFDYVYQAIQYSDVRYVLKADGDSLILENVSLAIKDVETDLLMETLTDKADIYYKMHIEHMRTLYITDLMEGSLKVSDINQQQFKELSICLSVNQPFILVLIRMDDAEGMSRTEINNQFVSIQNVAHMLLGSLTEVVSSIYSPSYIIVLLQPKTQMNLSWERACSFVGGTLETLLKTAQMSWRAPLSVAWLNKSSLIDELPQHFSFLKLLLMQFYGERGMILTDANDHWGSLNHQNLSDAIEGHVLIKKAGQLQNHLETRQQEACLRVIAEFKEALHGPIEKDNTFVFELFYLLGLGFSSLYTNLEERDRSVHLSLLTRWQELFLQGKWEAVWDYAKEMTIFLFELNREQMGKEKERAIYQVKQYINKHLDGDLTLIHLAEQIYLTPEYLSRLFKQTEGMTLSDYITNLKIHSAKENLKNPALQIQEVASQLGFTTAGYFSRFFKKVVGITPQEYRNRA